MVDDKSWTEQNASAAAAYATVAAYAKEFPSEATFKTAAQAFREAWRASESSALLGLSAIGNAIIGFRNVFEDLTNVSIKTVTDLNAKRRDALLQLENARRVEQLQKEEIERLKADRSRLDAVLTVLQDERDRWKAQAEDANAKLDNARRADDFNGGE